MAHHKGSAVTVDLGKLEGADEALAEAVEGQAVADDAARPAERREALGEGVRSPPAAAAGRDAGAKRTATDRRNIVQEAKIDQLRMHRDKADAGFRLSPRHVEVGYAVALPDILGVEIAHLTLPRMPL